MEKNNKKCNKDSVNDITYEEADIQTVEDSASDKAMNDSSARRCIEDILEERRLRDELGDDDLKIFS